MFVALELLLPRKDSHEFSRSVLERCPTLESGEVKKIRLQCQWTEGDLDAVLTKIDIARLYRLVIQGKCNIHVAIPQLPLTASALHIINSLKIWSQ